MLILDRVCRGLRRSLAHVTDRARRGLKGKCPAPRASVTLVASLNRPGASAFKWKREVEAAAMTSKSIIFAWIGGANGAHVRPRFVIDPTAGALEATGEFRLKARKALIREVRRIKLRLYWTICASNSASWAGTCFAGPHSPWSPRCKQKATWPGNGEEPRVLSKSPARQRLISRALADRGCSACATTHASGRTGAALSTCVGRAGGAEKLRPPPKKYSFSTASAITGRVWSEL
jgi:hypothetical protein